MAGLPGIVLRIGANTTDAVAGINQVQAKLGKFGQVAKDAGDDIRKSFSLKSLVAGVAAGIGFGKIVSQLGDMASAAAEDEKAVVTLRKALQNVGLGDASRKAEDFVRKLMLATGVADDDLRPALQRAATATGDLELAQRMLTDAVDVSAATGKDLSSVMAALSKASLGNFGALTKLGIPLDEGTVKSKDFGRALSELESRFGGQAAAVADSYSGKLERLATAAGEAQETIGYSLLGAVDDLGDSLGGTDGAVSGITALGDGVASIIDQSSKGVAAIRAIYDAIRDGAGASEEASIQAALWDRALGAAGDTAKQVAGGPLYQLGDAYDHFKSKVNDASTATNRYKHDLQAQAESTRIVADDSDAAAGAVEGLGAAGEAAGTRAAAGVKKIEVGVERSISSLQRLQGALDGIFSSDGSFGKAQEKFQQGVAWSQLLAQGPGKSGSNGTTTKDDYLNYANQIVSQAVATAKTLGPKAANKLLQNAQDRVTKLLGQAGYDNARAQAAALIGPVNTNPNPRLWENMYRDRPTSNRNVDPSRTATRRRDESDRANSRSAQRSAKTRARP